MKILIDLRERFGLDLGSQESRVRVLYHQTANRPQGEGGTQTGGRKGDYISSICTVSTLFFSGSPKSEKKLSCFAMRTTSQGHSTSPLSMASEEGVQELGIVAEGHASVRLAVRAQHVGVGQDAGATVHPAAVDGVEADGANPMKQLPAQSEIVDIRRRCTLHPQIHMAGIVHEAAKAGMGFQAAPARQVDGARRDIVDRGTAVIVQRRDLLARLRGANARFGNGRFRRRIGSQVLHVPIRRRSQAARKHPHGRLEALGEGRRTIIGRGETFIERGGTIIQSGETLV